MDTYFEKYNDYLDFLLKVECSKQNLDYGDTLKRIISQQAGSSKKEEPLTVTAKVYEPDSNGISIVIVFASGGKPPYTGAGDFEVEPGEHSFTVTDSNNQKKTISIIAKHLEIKEPEIVEKHDVIEIIEEPPTGTFSNPPLTEKFFDLEFSDGYYIGATLNRLMHGFGTRYWNNGKKWEGDWLNGEANGHIIVSFDDVITYDGNMVNSLPNGKGTYTDPDNGRTYIGDWVDFQREGEGKLQTREGEKIYEGEWKNDKYNGYGQSFLRGICRYEGTWVNGQRSGEGIAYDEEGNVEYQGIWENNDRVN